MSRWINSFNNHSFQKQWKQVIELSQTLIVADETVATNVEELARLRKVIVYIEKLLQAADPELIPESIWNSFNDQAAQCLSQMNQFNANKNIGHLINANSNLDNLLTYIRPYVVSGEGAAQAATSAFKSYSGTVNQQIDLLKSKAKEALTKTENNHKKTETLTAEIEQSKKNIRTLENSLLQGTDAEKSVKDKMLGLLQEATGWHKQISDFHRKLTTGSDQGAAIASQIEQAKRKVEEQVAAITEALQKTQKSIGELTVFHVKIFGEKKKDGTMEGGLQQELEVRLKQLSDFQEEQKKTYKTLLEEIETLLPGATSAGLSSAYLDLKESFNGSITHYSRLFYGSLVGIIIAGFILITHKIEFWSIEFVDINNTASLFNNMLYKLPILGSLLWLALFASRRRSEDRRLQQEYAHKEALAKSYQSFKQQIDALQTEDQDLTRKLLDTAIDAIALNASTTLDGKHGDKFPVQELAEKIVDAVTQLKSIKK